MEAVGAEAAADDRRGDRRVFWGWRSTVPGNLTRIVLGKALAEAAPDCRSGCTDSNGAAGDAGLHEHWAADQPAPRLWTVPARRAMMIGKRGSARLRRHMMKKRFVRSALSAARDAAAAPRAGETRVGMFTVSDPGFARPWGGVPMCVSSSPMDCCRRRFARCRVCPGGDAEGRVARGRRLGGEACAARRRRGEHDVRFGCDAGAWS